METSDEADRVRVEASAIVADTAPRWQQGPTDEVHCPMCEYNLYGLTEPRCPECGYRFVWKELLQTRARPHRYLFEHHAEANFKSFWKTAWGSLMPGTFWGSLHPAMPSKPRRLLGYWICVAAMAVLPVLARWAIWTYNVAVGGYPFLGGSRIFAQFPRRSLMPFPLGFSLLKPRPWSLEFLRAFFSYDRSDRNLGIITAMFLLWPWLTLLSLLVFSQTMRRVRTKPVHTLRCVIYTSGAAVWIVLPLLLLNLIPFVTLIPWRVKDDFANGVLVLAGILLGYRLAVAYKLYMKFDWPIATIIASQIIVWLTYLVLLVNSPI
jgi:hypothetical protein